MRGQSYCARLDVAIRGCSVALKSRVCLCTALGFVHPARTARTAWVSYLKDLYARQYVLGRLGWLDVGGCADSTRVSVPTYLRSNTGTWMKDSGRPSNWPKPDLACLVESQEEHALIGFLCAKSGPHIMRVGRLLCHVCFLDGRVSIR